MIKIICKNDEYNLKTKKRFMRFRVDNERRPHVISSELASALEEIYDANPEVIIDTMDILTHLIDKEIEKIERRLDDYE